MPNEVLHGNCLDLIPTLPDNSIDCVITSPPYAMQRAKHYGSVSEADYPAWTVAWMEALKPKLTANGSVLLNIRTNMKNGWLSPYVLKTRVALLEAGWNEAEELLWVKPDAPPIGNYKRPRRSWEAIHWFTLGRKPFCNPKACGTPSDRIGMVGGHSRFDLFGMSKPRSGTARIRDVIEVPVASNAKALKHPAAFPQKLTDILVQTFCPPLGTILDPFGGSGTVALSAIDHGRSWWLIEQKAEYAELARERITKKEADGF